MIANNFKTSLSKSTIKGLVYLLLLIFGSIPCIEGRHGHIASSENEIQLAIKKNPSAKVLHQHLGGCAICKFLSIQQDSFMLNFRIIEIIAFNKLISISRSTYLSNVFKILANRFTNKGPPSLVRHLIN
ncbi:hypothetical protein [Pedobacter lithocola]|uniref:hypothetical protein n=1 Tax=Pedobacter lithocola TaxID=1908239 RepID=UPI00366BDDC7